MISSTVVLTVSLLYYALLFLVAHYADKKRQAGQSITANSHVYSLSIAVYMTTWTFYGGVGRAATAGPDFLAAELGATLSAFTWWFLLRKMVRISKEQKITNIADFISSRYGKSAALGTLVTLIAVMGIMPYIALQLKAVAHSFDLLTGPVTPLDALGVEMPSPIDTAFLVALVLGLFGVLFGARRLDASEHHDGLMAAVAMDSLVKIAALLSVGIFVTYGLFDGAADIFTRFAAKYPERSHLLFLDPDQTSYPTWFTLLFISMMAIMVLPRQFHVMVVENSDENHIKSAMWQLPTYEFLINLFVIPIALGGLLYFGGDASNADYFVLHLPLRAGHPWLAMFVFLGGFSAAAGMVMISSVALSTMILNYLVMPVILKLRLEIGDISRTLLNIKRLGILGVVFSGYFFYRLVGESYALLNIGMIALLGATQFIPSLIGGLYWRRANLVGAVSGLVCGFVLWFYTLIIPAFVRSGWMNGNILDSGLFGLNFLRPLQLFGLNGLDIWTHSLCWTLFFNVGAFVSLSLIARPKRNEAEQASRFVDVFVPTREIPKRQRLSKAPTIMEFVDLMAKFVGEKQAHGALSEYLGDRLIDERGSLSDSELPGFKRFVEKTLAGSVGSAPARIIVENYLATKGSHMEDVFDIFGSVTISRRTGQEQLGVLHETSRLVSSGVDLQTILDNILELFRQQFKFDLCVIRFLDEERMALTVRSQKGMSSEHFGESERKLNMDSYSGTAFLTNTLTVVNDTDFLDKPAIAAIVHREGIKSFAHAPIVIEGMPVGILSAYSKSAKGIFTDEFNDLFNNLAGQVGVAWRNAGQTEKLIEAREQERELKIARAIQLGLLPTRTPAIKGITLAGTCVPAREVGGDYYDFLSRGDSALDLVVADVSGHSVGSALIMAQTRTFIKDRPKEGNIPSVSEILNALNEFFYEDLSRAEQFITMAYLNFDVETRVLSFANAGHPPSLIWRARSGDCQWLDAEGLILGVLPKIDFKEERERLYPGDILLLYTDGIIEAENSEGNFFGANRLCLLLKDYHALSCEQLLDRILLQGRLFTGKQNFVDDVSLVVMKVD